MQKVASLEEHVIFSQLLRTMRCKIITASADRTMNNFQVGLRWTSRVSEMWAGAEEEQNSTRWGRVLRDLYDTAAATPSFSWKPGTFKQEIGLPLAAAIWKPKYKATDCHCSHVRLALHSDRSKEKQEGKETTFCCLSPGDILKSICRFQQHLSGNSQMIFNHSRWSLPLEATHYATVQHITLCLFPKRINLADGFQISGRIGTKVQTESPPPPPPKLNSVAQSRQQFRPCGHTK